MAGSEIPTVVFDTTGVAIMGVKFNILKTVPKERNLNLQLVSSSADAVILANLIAMFKLSTTILITKMLL